MLGMEDEESEPEAGTMTPDEMAAVLDGILGAYERARLGPEQAARGETIALDDLV